MKAEKNAKRLKVLKNVLKKEICFEDYIHCLLNNEIIHKKNKTCLELIVTIFIQ